MSIKEIINIGFKNNKIANFDAILRQIMYVKRYKLNPVDDDGELVRLVGLDNSVNKNMIFRAIIEDRKLRVDKKISLADSPNFCEITIIDDVIERLEYYEGHDKLKYDTRSNRLTGVELGQTFVKDEWEGLNDK